MPTRIDNGRVLFRRLEISDLSPDIEHRGRLDDLVQADSKSAAHFIPVPNADDLQLLIHSRTVLHGFA
jgi:hypothetical protein